MKKLLLLAMVLVLIPTLIIGVDHKEEIIYKIKYGIVSNKLIKLKKSETGEVESIPLEKYVIGVVAGEMPATFNIEALKAQAVASRTYVLKRSEKGKEYDVDNTTNNQVYIEEDTMKDKWKDKYNENIKKIKKAVLETKGEVILYNNQLIDSMFFSTSNGYTENSSAIFSNDLPYLRSVDSSWDKQESPVFSSTAEVSKPEFLYNLGLSTNNEIVIKDIEKTSSNRIKNITINNKKFKGTELRRIFKLKSTCFDIKIEENKVIFNVTGYGHGVGMSQYGANGMAKEGYNYKDILKHYYQNCEIKNIN